MKSLVSVVLISLLISGCVAPTSAKKHMGKGLEIINTGSIVCGSHDAAKIQRTMGDDLYSGESGYCERVGVPVVAGRWDCSKDKGCLYGVNGAVFFSYPEFIQPAKHRFGTFGVVQNAKQYTQHNQE